MSFSISPAFKQSCQKLDICNQTIDDNVIADRIKKSCPRNAYSWIQVQSLSHQFKKTLTPYVMPSRMVRFQPRNLEAVKNIVGIIFRKIKIEDSGLTQLALGMLGSKDPKAQAKIQSAFRQNITITLFIAMDGSYNYEIFSTQGKVTKFVATHFGKKKEPDEDSEEKVKVVSKAPKCSRRCVIL